MGSSLWLASANPLGNELLSAGFAALPVLYLCWAIAIRKLRIHVAALTTLLICVLVAVLVFDMPLRVLWRSALAGAVFGVFPICTIIAAAIFIYLLAQKSHYIEVISDSLLVVSKDKRVQALLVAFAFGAFLEASSGFGAPVTITAALLMGLGFPAHSAIAVCLLANTTPVVFGGVGLPIIVGAKIADVDQLLLSALVVRTLFVVNIILPFYITALVGGWRAIGGVLPAILVCGFSYSLTQLFVAKYAGPPLTGIVSALACIISLLTLLFFWSPGNNGEPTQRHHWRMPHPLKTLLWAWSPFMLLCFFITIWSIKPIKTLLGEYGNFHFYLGKIVDAAGFSSGIQVTLNLCSSPASALLLAGFFAILTARLPHREVGKASIQTAKTICFPALTIVSVLCFSYIMNHSGMAVSLGRLFVATGHLFPFFSPFLGYLGVFITGSLTASVALFTKMQESAAATLGIDPLVAVSANICGAAFGKMISPQSITIVATVTGQSGNETKFFRNILKHSLILTTLVGIIVTLQSLVMRWLAL